MSLFDDPENHPSITQIKRVVAGHFGLPLSVMRSRRREGIRARFVAIYLAYEMTPQTLTAIGAAFGDRDHSTIRHGINAIKTLIATEPATNDMLDQLRRTLRPYPEIAPEMVPIGEPFRRAAPWLRWARWLKMATARIGNRSPGMRAQRPNGVGG